MDLINNFLVPKIFIIKRDHNNMEVINDKINLTMYEDSLLKILSEHSFLNINMKMIRNKRSYMIYGRPKSKRKKNARQKCKPTKSESGLSVFTFLNFVISSISIAANLISNNNNNNNNSNNNNNNNNNEKGKVLAGK